MNSINSQRLVFHGAQQVEFENYHVPAPGLGEIRIQSRFSLMSTGTENIVFNRLFDPGTHWDHWVKYPFYPGYATSGIIESIGEGVGAFQVGDRVACRMGHCSHGLAKASACYPLPDGMPLDLAVWFALAKIAFHGALAADYHLGVSVLVIGAGPIGQMSLRWARAAGASSIIVVDAVKERQQIAITGGASAYIATPIAEAREAILNANNGELPQCVIDSTGHPAVFASALGLATKGGRVVLLGDTGQPGKQTLTGDLLLKGLHIVGAHDGNQFPGWNEASITSFFYRLAVDGRFSLEGLNSHSFSPGDCAEAYAVANRERAKTMGILFKWNS